ncbi:YheC/YheD family protein [Paenibacillus alkaliterrae]|uniref:YheC/YheD family endospore coat-associated protein n=1 Tax=Paenibacillus alkaliterrae TaxID=320909 RepID=UPI001F3EA067|nr:YheC/YheD family protein [Paenibacillus alkaliterrae]MCF2937372.1 YheC/YheD family protein [Paenibacillus alkaliterrae]
MQDQIINLGILVASIPYRIHEDGASASLPEPAFYRALSLNGKQHGIDVYVFEADGYHSRTGRLQACRFEQNRWVRQLVPLPDVIYDRCFFTTSDQRLSCRRMLYAIAQRKPHVMLNGNLPAKLDVYDSLKGDALLMPYLPVTIGCRSAEQLKKMIDQYAAGIVLKPSSGMQGRGLVHISRCPLYLTLTARGRSKQNRPFLRQFEDDSAFMHWIDRFIGRTSYLLQPYLELSGDDGKPFDVRSLMQKDEKGRWSLSGIAVRTGQPGSLTSNLHGGGDAKTADMLLTAKFGIRKAERLIEQIHTISKQTADRLENHFGRFAELGLDFGIERSGRIWLIEANSKPGRSSFRKIGDHAAELSSIERPLLYARFLSRRLYSSMAANETVNGRHRHLIAGNPLRPFNVQEVHR